MGAGNGVFDAVLASMQEDRDIELVRVTIEAGLESPNPETARAARILVLAAAQLKNKLQQS